MSDKEQIDAFADDLDRLVSRYCDEFDLTCAAAIGVLQMKAWLIIQAACKHEDEL
jgi:hypothetical protein